MYIYIFVSLTLPSQLLHSWSISFPCWLKVCPRQKLVSCLLKRAVCPADESDLSQACFPSLFLSLRVQQLTTGTNLTPTFPRSKDSTCPPPHDGSWKSVLQGSFNLEMAIFGHSLSVTAQSGFLFYNSGKITQRREDWIVRTILRIFPLRPQASDMDLRKISHWFVCKLKFVSNPADSWRSGPFSLKVLLVKSR